MGVLSEGNVRVSLPPRDAPRRRSTAFLEVLPGAVRAVRERLGVRRSPPDGRPRTAERSRWTACDALGRRCPQPVIELGPGRIEREVPVRRAR